MTPSNRPTIADLSKGPLGQVAASLSAAELSLIADDIAALEKQAKDAKVLLLAVSKEKYATSLEGHALGTKRIEAEGVDVVFDIPKNVSWDNEKLAAVETKTDQWGKPIWTYLDVTRKISETAFKKLPDEVLAEVQAARTVKPGAMTVKFQPREAN